MKQIAIIGGGASGFAAAISLAQKCKSCHVTIFERLEKPLKKILATGNGRCNLTNMRASKKDYFGDISYFHSIFSKFSPQSTIEFFESLGLLCKEEELGRVYPLSAQASSVREILLAGAKELSVEIQTDIKITKVQKNKNGGFLLNDTFACDFLVFAFGGKAAPKQGTDGSGYDLLKQLSIPMVTPVPALTALYCKNHAKSLKGVRNICHITLLVRQKPIYEISGEVQFTDYGLSGVPIMQLSRLCSAHIGEPIAVKLDCLPLVKAENLFLHFLNAQKKHPSMEVSLLLSGLFPKALAEYILKCAHIQKEMPLQKAETKALKNLVHISKNLEFEVMKTKGFDFAQVTAGGADGRAFFDTTLECKKIPHLYACGEALNVDGGCGGYNLQWAWCSGRAVGEAIAKEITL